MAKAGGRGRCDSTTSRAVWTWGGVAVSVTVATSTPGAPSAPTGGVKVTLDTATRWLPVYDWSEITVSPYLTWREARPLSSPACKVTVAAVPWSRRT